jgi:hypothetical protein
MDTATNYQPRTEAATLKAQIRKAITSQQILLSQFTRELNALDLGNGDRLDDTLQSNLATLAAETAKRVALFNNLQQTPVSELMEVGE